MYTNKCSALDNGIYPKRNWFYYQQSIYHFISVMWRDVTNNTYCIKIKREHFYSAL